MADKNVVLYLAQSMSELKLLYIVCVVLLVMNLKWMVMILMFPFQVMGSKWAAYKQLHGKNSILLTLLASPYLFFERIICRGGWQRYMLFQIGLFPSCHLRKAVYKALGAKIGKNVIFHFKTEVRSPERLVVFGGAIIGDNAILDARGGLEIGEDVNLSSNVSIYTLQHDHRDPDFNCTNWNATVRIGKRAWLGSNVIILPGVNIGEGAVCCAGCVVTKDVEPYAVVAGIPAKKVNERPRNLKYHFDGKSCRFY